MNNKEIGLQLKKITPDARLRWCLGVSYSFEEKNPRKVNGRDAPRKGRGWEVQSNAPLLPPSLLQKYIPV